MSKPYLAILRAVARPSILGWAVLAIWLLAAGCSQEPAATMVVSGPWIKAPVPGQVIAAGYLSVENRGAGEEVLLGIECADAAAVEMHEMFHESDMMKMRKLEQAVLPGHSTLAFAPGGAHLMLLGLRRQLKEGDTVGLTLHFKQAGDRTISVPVKKQ